MDALFNSKLFLIAGFYLPAIIISLSIHEYGHALAAKWLGDDTAEREGRLTLNPIAHMDLWGTLLVPLLLYLASGLMFGWAKPVPVNIKNLRNPKIGMVLVASAFQTRNFIIRKSIFVLEGLSIFPIDHI